MKNHFNKETIQKITEQNIPKSNCKKCAKVISKKCKNIEKQIKTAAKRGRSYVCIDTSYGLGVCINYLGERCHPFNKIKSYFENKGFEFIMTDNGNTIIRW